MPKFHALLIGIDEYADTDELTLQPLLGSINDVECMADFLAERFGRAVVLTKLVAPRGGKPQGPLPTREAMRLGFEALLDFARPGDQVLIYFSGHGIRLPTSQPEMKGEDAFDECLVPAGTLKPIEESVLRDHEIHERVQLFLGKDILVTLIFDCCHSGGASKGYFPWNASTAISRDLTCRNPWIPEALDGSVFLASCQPHQEAHQKLVGQKFQGYMTHCLVETLKASDQQLTWEVATS